MKIGDYELDNIYNEDCYEAIHINTKMIELYNCDCLNLIKSGNLHGKKICIVTDPPFNINYHYRSYKDKLNEDEYIKFLSEVLTFNGFPFVIIHYPENLYKISFKTGCLPEKVVSWVYNSNTPRQHRDIAFFRIKPDFKKIIQPYKNLNDKRIQKRISEGNLGGSCMIGGRLIK